MNRLVPAAALAAFGLFLGAACSAANVADSPPAARTSGATATQPAASPGGSSATRTATAAPGNVLSAAELVKLAEPSVVRIQSANSVGSGFVVSEDGYIITNNHVVAGTGASMRAVSVTLSDGGVFPARVIGTDERSDLALLKIDAPDPLAALPLADLDTVSIGDDVIAIGYALDLSQGEGPSFTVTRGIVSQKNRSISESSAIMGSVQTDAAINHGNSGGPLLNMLGEVVGVNTALQPDLVTGAPAQGIGYAVGSDTVRAVYEELAAEGAVSRGFLGIQDFESLRPAKARDLGLPDDTRGIVLPANANSVVPGTPAAAAGIMPGDVITAIAGTPIESEGDLAVAMIKHAPGEDVDVDLYRAGQPQTVTVTLGTPPA